MTELSWEEHEKLFEIVVSSLPDSHYGVCKTYAEAYKLEEGLCHEESMYDCYISKEVVKFGNLYYLIDKDDLTEDVIIRKGKGWV